GRDPGADGIAMLPQEGVETFGRILGHSAPRRVAVSTTDLQTRIDQWINFKSAAAAAGPGGQAAALHARPELGVDCVAPRNETEQTIAGIWQELLGIEPIGVHDTFSELGGQSLLATQVVARVRAALQTELPLRRFFEGPTVAELALAATPQPKQAAGEVRVAVEQPVEATAV